MSDFTPYVPPKVWRTDTDVGGRFAGINRPVAGPTHDKELPVGEHPLQLYSLATPNGIKVTVMLEELLCLVGCSLEDRLELRTDGGLDHARIRALHIRSQLAANLRGGVAAGR